MAPTTQNQLSASRHSHTGWLARATRSNAAVSRAKFQPTGRSGAPDGAREMASEASAPAIAMPSPATETIAGPFGIRKSAPPATVPARMPRKVPASTSPLPATSSRSARWSGRIAYFSGPKNVECTPMPNSTANSSGMLPSRNPQAATAIRPISASLTQTMTRRFSNRSAISPAVAESRT